ncbi:MAG: recombinase family protein [Albidovulum sp.]|nr:recombinase family protein [Albidovulum sp.]
MLAGIARFERDLISERVKSGLVAAKARGKRLGRQPGHRPPSRTSSLPVFWKLSMRDRATAGLPAIPAFSRTLSPASSSGTGTAPEAGSFHTVSVVLEMTEVWCRGATCQPNNQSLNQRSSGQIFFDAGFNPGLIFTKRLDSFLSAA